MTTSYFGNIINYFEWIAFLASFNCLNPVYPKSMRLFPVILGIIVLIEILAAYMGASYNYNGLAYNFLELIWFPGYIYIFYGLIENRKFKKPILIIGALFLLFALFDFLRVINLHLWLAHRTFVAGSLAVITCAIFALLEIGNEKKLYKLKNEPVFWIATAMLFYFFPTAIVLEGYEYFGQKDGTGPEAFGVALRYSQKILNVIHYSLLTYAFICRTKTIKNKFNLYI